MAAPTIITTTHDSDGLSVFRENPTFKSFGKAVTILYSTQDARPINFANDADLDAFEAREYPALTPTEGAVVLIAEWPPNGEKELHRNLCLDLGVMLSGEVELILDGGETKILKPGDVMIHRATMHGWKNYSSTEPARMLFFLLPAEGVPTDP